MGFYDAKGYWRSDGDGFYDAKGYFRSLGDGFYDAKGYFRSAGDGFYDAKGNWVSPGGAFYDSKGYLRTVGVAATADTWTDIVIMIGFLLFIPIGLLWGMTIFFVEWMASHLYAVFVGYIIADAVLSLAITKSKKYHGVKFALSYFGSFLCILPFVYTALVYAVPYVIINEGSFASFFEFTLVLAVGFGGIAVVQFFNYYHEKAILELIIGILFFVFVIMLLKKSISEMDTIESFARIYHTEVSVLLKVLFGFVI